MKSLKILFLVMFLPIWAAATHLVGGNISYTYLGDPDGNGLINYRVTLITFQNCNSPFWGSGFPEDPVAIGVYRGNFSGTNAVRETIVNVNLIDTQTISYNIQPNCGLQVDTCINRAAYEAIVELPSNTVGYSLYYDRCCRTPNVVNLTVSGDQGDAYYAYIPPTIVNNSSPIFNDVSVPFVCIGDTFTYFNSVTDPDGDLLQFNLVDPWFGYDDDLTPSNPPSLNLALPIPTVNWAFGFNATNPFGPNGYSFINSSTGFSRFLATQLGPYVITVEVREFRNGNLVGISRRNIQFTVLNCPPNSPPNNQAPVSNGSVSVTIEEGDSTCIPITYVDLDGDSIFFLATGDALDASVVNPPGFIPPTPPQPGTLTTQFCWNTQCGQARAVPYTFTSTVIDNACIPEPAGETYVIEITPFEGPSTLSGTQTPCVGQSGVLYEVDSIAGASYVWSVTGGAIVSSPNPWQAIVDWGNTTGNFQLEVTATSRNGCQAAPFQVPIFIQNVQASMGSDNKICEGDSITLGGSPTLPPGFSYSWSSPGLGTFSTSSNPLITLDTTRTYILDAVDPNGCAVRDSITIPVYLNDTVSIGNDTVICSDNRIRIIGTGGDTYGWSALDNPVNLTVIQQGIADFELIGGETRIEMTARTNLGCDFRDTLLVELDSTPQADAGNDTVICRNERLRIGGNFETDSGVTFSWFPTANLDSATSPQPIVDAAVTQQYELTVTSPKGCVNRDSISLTVLNLPNITAGPDTSICRLDTITLFATGGASYRWISSPFLEDTSIANTRAFPTDSTSFVVFGIDGNGCENSDTAHVSVFERVLNLGDDRFLCPGDSVDVPINSGTNFTWTPTTGVSDTNSTTPKISVFASRVYTLESTSANGCREIDTLEIIVDNIIPTDAGPDTAICINDSLFLGGSPTALGNVNFSWTNVAAPFDTSSNPKVAPTVATQYVVFTSSDTCSGIDTINVQINALPVFTTSADTTICAFDTAQLRVNESFVSYAWTPDSVITQANLQVVAVSPSQSTRFYVQVTDSNSCSASDSIEVTVSPAPLIQASNDAAICRGDTLQVSASGGISYQWFPAGLVAFTSGSTTLATASTDTVIFVRGTDGIGCSNVDSVVLTMLPIPQLIPSSDTLICNGDNAILSVQGALSYEWLNSRGFLNDSTIRNPVASPDSSFRFRVVGTDVNGCEGDTSIFVAVNQLGDIEIIGDTSACLGSGAQLGVLNATNPSWLPTAGLNNSASLSPIATPNSTTIYTVSATDTFGCLDRDTMRLRVLPLPFADAGGNRSVCRGSSVLLGGNPSGPAGSRFSWSPLNVLPNPNLANPIFSPSQTQGLILLVTDTNGCRQTDSITVGIFDFSLSVNDTSICFGDEVQIDFNYEFSVGTKTIQLSNTNELVTLDTSGFRLLPNTISSYVVTATNGSCVETETLDLGVYPSPTADFEQKLVPTCNGISIEAENYSSGANRIEWILNGSVQSREDFPRFNVPYSSDLDLELIAYNNFGCRDTANFSERVSNLVGYAPGNLANVITPNGDGINDFFEIPFESDFAECLEVTIYNRWGNLIFESSNNNFSWDGRNFAGKLMPEGTYFYVVYIDELQLKGTVSLYR